MLFPPLRSCSLAALLALLASLAGCETFRSAPPDSPNPNIPAQAVLQAAENSQAPGKKPPIRRGNYLFYHDFNLDPNDPLFAELEALPEQLYDELGLPSTTAIIQVYLFETQERYSSYMRANYKRLEQRRAYMIVDRDQIKVFTWMGEHLRTDLRHELTHALLHSSWSEMPLWLDEGLASFFELPPANDGLNPQHLELIARGPFLPDMARLERMTQVPEMQKPEYREAWAWVHLMLRGQPAAKQVLRDYLQTMRNSARPGPLLPRLKALYPDLNQALYEHLTQCRTPQFRAAGP